MKQIPAVLMAALDSRTVSYCYLIKIVSERSGAVYGFTTSDARIEFDDGIHNVVYSPVNSLTPQNIQEVSDMDTDTTEAHGWFTDAIRRLFDAGEMDGGEATVYRVLYDNLAAGAELIMFGVVAGVKYEADPNSPRKVQIRGLDHLLKTKRNDLYSITCRNDFGDARCGKTFTWSYGTISAVEDGFLQFTVSGIAADDGYFDSGVIRFTSGDNQGAELEIETWGDDNVRLSFATPYPVSIGDTVSLRRDCNKFAETCINTYANIVNFNGEHLTPVQDKSLMIPGAYIKSQGAK